jgi:hypothetical protein
MTLHLRIAAGLGLVALLGGCLDSNLGVAADGTTPVIARGYDTGFDEVTLPQQRAAIAYDPDGCQNWLLDDGLEGYATRRRDPVSGLPVCNNQFPPGTVVREYRTNRITDYVPN